MPSQETAQRLVADAPRQALPTRFYVGTSGWHYFHWQGRFYPLELPRERWLGFYGGHFPTVEINYSFYHMPRESTFRAWREQSQEGFLFAVKASRLITHLKRLQNVQEPLDTFTGRAKALGDRLGPILYQLPPSLRRNDSLLGTFLAILPKELRHVVEFRHISWYDDAVYELLRRYNTAFCVHDYERRESPVVATADFAYLRFHGTTGRYAGGYSDEALEGWAESMCGMGQGRQAVFAFFNNDVGGDAVANATTLTEKLKEKGAWV